MRGREMDLSLIRDEFTYVVHGSTKEKIDVTFQTFFFTDAEDVELQKQTGEFLAQDPLTRISFRRSVWVNF